MKSASRIACDRCHKGQLACSRVTAFQDWRFMKRRGIPLARVGEIRAEFNKRSMGGLRKRQKVVPRPAAETEKLTIRLPLPNGKQAVGAGEGEDTGVVGMGEEEDGGVVGAGRDRMLGKQRIRARARARKLREQT